MGLIDHNYLSTIASSSQAYKAKAFPCFFLESGHLFVRYAESVCKEKTGLILANFRSSPTSSGAEKTLFEGYRRSALANQTLNEDMQEAPTVEKFSQSDAARSYATAQE